MGNFKKTTGGLVLAIALGTILYFQSEVVSFVSAESRYPASFVFSNMSPQFKRTNEVTI